MLFTCDFTNKESRAACEMHGNAGFPSVHTANAINHCLARHVLEQIAFRPRLNGSVNIFVVIERREHDDPSVLIVSRNLLDNTDAIELGACADRASLHRADAASKDRAIMAGGDDNLWLRLCFVKAVSEK